MSETQVQTEVQFDNTDDLDAFASDFFGEKSKATPAAKQDAEQDDTKVEDEKPDTEAQTTDDAELTDEDEAEAEAELAKEPPKKSKVQERIDELVRQKHEAERKSEADKAELRAEFEAKLAALRPKTEQPKSAEPTPDALNEDGTAKYELGEFDPSYIRDLTRFTLQKERAEAMQQEQVQRQTQEREAANTALYNSWNEKMEAAKERLPDLQVKGQELLNGFQNLNKDYADYLGTVLMSMDYGPDVLDYLANNPGEAKTIVNSGAQKATLALGRIEAKFAEAEAQKLVAKPKLSKAPPPPAVTARGTAGGSKTVEGDTDNLDAFAAEFFRKKR